MNYKNLSLIFLFLILIIALPFTSALIPNESMKIFAVSDNKAMTANLNISIVEGTGKIFSSIDESLVGSSTQASVKNAVKVTYDVVGDKIKNKYNFIIDIESKAYSIDGPSAGGSIALLMISMFQDINLSNEIGMTGSITSDGTIGDVGGIYFKAKKAAEVGVKLFLIPTGNRKQMISEDGEIKDIDLVNYAYENWDLKIVEVKNISEVLKYSKMNISDIDINKTSNTNKEKYMPTPIKYSVAVKPMKDLVEKYIFDANNEINKIKFGIDNNSVTDMGILQNLLGVFDYAKQGLEDALLFNKNNYFYSSANSSFVTFVNINTVNEIIENPSVLSANSTIFDLKVQSLENKIKLTENRLNLCSLDNFEWCIGAKQRLTWAKDKLEKIKSTNYALVGNGLSKISDYSYALGWVNISNDFLSLGITDSTLKFKEANHFKELAQKQIIAVENEMILNENNINTDEDFLRRLNSAKINFKKGWYVTSLYDSKTAMSVLVSDKENAVNFFDISAFEKKYNELNKNLKSNSALNSKNNVWSKLYFDHAEYYYNSYLHFKNKSLESEAQNSLLTANSIVNISYYLYDLEKVIIPYYDSADIQVLIEDMNTSSNTSSEIEENYWNDSKGVQSVYVYGKDNKENNILMYALIIGILIILITFSLEFLKFKKHHSSEGLLKQISSLDKDLLEGRLSPFTYKEMRRKYLQELQVLTTKDNKKVKIPDSSELISQKQDINLEKQIIDKQISELNKRKKELIKENKKLALKKKK